MFIIKLDPFNQFKVYISLIVLIFMLFQVNETAKPKIFSLSLNKGYILNTKIPL